MAIRNARQDAGLEPQTWLAANVCFTDADARAATEALSEAVARLARVRIQIVETRDALDAVAPASALAVLERAAEARLTADASDLERERLRLQKERGDAEGLLAGARGRIANAQFLAKAPPDVVAGARARVAELEERIARLDERLAATR